MKAFAPRTKLETGYKANARWLDRDYPRDEGLARHGRVGAAAI